ncbi:hypothetical protein GB931_02425 [Modestobacter sp. I12A-02628]|uniref:SipW-cognate class signal peptide n=1 Tax=Goekera deserti TaxID=2497753 RepID=A0A7K3WFG7_9ACTN|nr:TasA family protein [Goekera deserti]MPQ96794.1 hypothetical protein [Goekera deserti]NDI46892.1 hypothetical protein [Goekera deserti]NEL54460.1 hypothetical protein [Goekera deserti]
MKKLVLTSAAMGGVALIALSTGGTFAGFTDSAAATGPAVAAGTLSVTVDAPAQAPTIAGNLIPGSTGIYPFLVRNTGSTPGYLHGSIADVVNDENGCAAEEKLLGDDCTKAGPGSGELGAQLTVGYYVDKKAHNYQECQAIKTLDDAVGTADLGTLNAFTVPKGSFEVEPKGALCMLLVLTLPTTADNKVQSDTAAFTATFTLDQLKG